MTEPLNAVVGQYRQASAMNPPPPIGSDSLTLGGTPIEELLRVLGVAANSGDPLDDAEGMAEHTERRTATADAAEAFAQQDGQAAGELAGVAQVPQLVTGIAGAAGGALQSLGQLPQQLAQALQQAAQWGLTAVSGTTGSPAAGGALDDDGFEASDVPDGGLADGDAYGDFGTDPLGTGPLGTDPLGRSPWPEESPGPAVVPGPAAIPGPATPPLLPPLASAGTSAGTSPASASVPAVTPAHTAQPTPATGMAGMPMTPAMTGALGADRGGTAAAPDGKRVAVPPVRNGAPVQGRITATPVRPNGEGGGGGR